MEAASRLRVVFEPRAEPHATDLYAYDSVVDGVIGFEAVGETEIARYREDGFLLVRKAFGGAHVCGEKLVGFSQGTRPFLIS